MTEKHIIQKRNAVIKSIDRILAVSQNIEVDPEAFIQFQVRYEDLHHCKLDFDRFQAQIEYDLSKKGTNEEITEQELVREEFDEKLYKIKSLYFKFVKLESKPQSDTSFVDYKSNVKLPKLTVPTFSGDLASWTCFSDLFQTLVHKNDSLSAVEKFQYLKLSLINEPHNLIKNIAVNSGNYQIAWNILEKRYDNKRLIATHHVEKILALPSCTTQSQVSLKLLSNTINESLSALKVLKLPIEHWSFLLTVIVLKKLDSDTRRSWEATLTDRTAYPSFTNLINFIDDQVSVLESLNNKTEPLVATITGISSNNRGKSTRSSTFVTNNRSSLSGDCNICHGNHFIYHCPAYKSKSAKERFNLAKQYNLCINCLSSSHILKSCKSNRSCFTCGKQHHTSLHFDQRSEKSSPIVSQTNKTDSNNHELSVSTLTSSNRNCSSVLLGTALAEIVNQSGKAYPVRIMLDCASQASYITESCVCRTGLYRRPSQIQIFALGEVQLDNSLGTTSCNIRPRSQKQLSFMTTAIIVKRITGNMPSSNIKLQSMSYLHNVTLADPNFGTPSQVDMLIGADLFPHLLLGGRIPAPPGYPTALETVFGWILMGSINLKSNTINTFHLSNDLISDQDTSFNDIVKRFWEIEEIQPPSNTHDPENDQCETIFQNTTQRHDCGRYSVSLPFRTYPPNLGDSYRSALQCLHSLQRRLIANPQLREEYTKFMQEYLDCNHMTLISNPNLNELSYYIPHHCVMKPESTSTKLRVVFNASKPTDSGLSLNDTLLTGSALQQDLASILTRFRFHSYVITADIKQMYRQILVHPEHRAFQRILWSFDFSKPPQTYELNTVTYGLNCAPYLALRTLKQLAIEESSKYSNAVRVLNQDTYVDDVITGCDTLNDAIALQQELSQLLETGGFILRKWTSNDSRVLSLIPDEYKQSTSNLNLDHGTVKVLGLHWNPSSDSYVYKINSANRGCTKRIIMSEIAKIFDPLGWLAPLTMVVKRIIQLMWSLSLEWDERPPQEIVSRWQQFQEQCPALAAISIPRFIENNKIDLLGFCDASEAGYAAVIYCRSSEALFCQTTLLCAKTRVAPLKRISLPRLELCAAVLLARIVKFLKESLTTNIANTYAWSDSTVTLAWIHSSPHRWKTFVSNRVTEIQSVIPPECWRHIRSVDNPADCASRGLLPNDLLSHSIWWNGPPLLTLPTTAWTVDANTIDSHESSAQVNVEERKISLNVLVCINNSSELLNKYSSLTKLKRITAWCFRFYNHCKFKSNNTSQFLTAEELNHALCAWIKIVQTSSFDTEIIALQNHKSGSRYFRKLNPFTDSDGIIRVGGRIRHSKLAYDQKHPILLPQRSQLTQLIIDHYHKSYLHPGPQALHAILSQKYWILSARSVIRHRITQCHSCFRVNPRADTPLMADLPARRVTRVKPFQTVGVDYGGPFPITFNRARGIRSQKAYLCLFVCFATKSLHLELASSLSTDAFLAAFRRFIARRGRCNHIYSDCGTNFVGAQRYLSDLLKLTKSTGYNEIMSSALVNEGIEWHFNPPSAPHFGGIWEAGIKSVKKHLIRVVGDRILTYEELNTVFVEIEALLNSRPLCPLSADPNDLTALTPGHFLISEPPVRLPDRNVTDVPVNRLNRWQLLQQIQQHFWKRWHNEYLNTLQQRCKWNKVTSNIAVNSLVLIKDELVSPIRWRLGRIVSIHPGPDGIVRVADVRTSTGVSVRPVVKLCVLPTEAQ